MTDLKIETIYIWEYGLSLFLLGTVNTKACESETLEKMLSHSFL